MAFCDRSGRFAHDNVVSLNARQHHQPLDVRLGHHANLFCEHRRAKDDVHWLKENAEYLNILTSLGIQSDTVLNNYAGVYTDIDEMLGQFPQYYRFLLSICLDLEDLGMGGDKGARLCRWANRQGLAEAELSDLQRGEALRLLSRRGACAQDPGLRDRLLQFAGRTATFTIPNRKAAYELTHILFYLSDYGRIDPGVGQDVIQSLGFAGLLAYLDQDYDLLAEVCTALRHAGQTPSPIWEGAVLAALGSAAAMPVPEAGESGQDMYHTYLVTNWLAGLAGQEVMPLMLQGGPVRLDLAPAPARPIVRMAQLAMTGVGADWDRARHAVVAGLEDQGTRILEAAENSVPDFARFFEGFARAARP